MDPNKLYEPRVREYIDPATFEQIVGLDDDDDMSFTKSMLSSFYDQFQDSIKEMEQALAAKDLPGLSSSGHFLKGSSAALGLWRIQDCCEKIQHLGFQKDESGAVSIDNPQICLDRISELLILVKQIFTETKNAISYLGF
ncbi:uncharacterized protein SAPINGB_P004685 [Magnusiomyces paraingens]|uniref:HPt domain-containing protein n=1 Tax=Magnusiomyces paraingens TaxID=2606893 RepID=A0A5E8BVW6_9ASCO|nr:uncharacterized protein SAPINGB_P004685 [Saprochaete ingens]VVT55666.1 unnamed protein product [Saprochaete ingens]